MLAIDLTFIVIFLLVWSLVLVLTRVFFKPVGWIMEKRRDRESADRNAAREALEAGERDLRRIEDEIKEARASSERLREELEAQALGEKARLISEVQADARDRIEKAKAEIEEQVRRLKDQLEGEVGRLADSIEKKVAH
jgi:F-type H+-transporting ATPase subunit b